MPSAVTISELWRYPVKSMGGESLRLLRVGAHGVPGDRHWAVFDKTTGQVTSGKKIPRLMQCRARYQDGAAEAPVLILLPDGSELRSDEPRIHEGLSDFLERPVKLVARERPDDHFDAYPLHLLSSGSLAALRAVNSESEFSALRFRPNIVVDLGSEVSAVEMGWCGATVTVQGVVLRIEGPTERCSMIMRAQAGLPEDAALLRTVVQQQNHVGVYASVESTGVIELGQKLRVAAD